MSLVKNKNKQKQKFKLQEEKLKKTKTKNNYYIKTTEMNCCLLPLLHLHLNRLVVTSEKARTAVLHNCCSFIFYYCCCKKRH